LPLPTQRSKSGRKKEVDKGIQREYKGFQMKKENKKKYNMSFTPSVFNSFEKMIGESGLSVSAFLELQMRTMLNAKRGVFKVFDAIYEMGKEEGKEVVKKISKVKTKNVRHRK
jgi:hypothetical protein